MEARAAAPTAISANPIGQIMRPARVLIGWMSPDEARLWLAGRRPDQQGRPEHNEKFERAHAAVAARAPGIDQTCVTHEAPEELSAYIQALRQHPSSAAYFKEGWQVAIADLSRVCAAQPHLYTDHAAQRASGVDAGDILALAAVSLPIPTPTALSVQFNDAKQIWSFSSPNPNLRISGHFGGPVQPGVNGFGFVVDVSASFVQVASYRGRHFLRDGYHRAYGFLSRGITRVPVFVREFTTFNELALPVGLLPQDVFLGDRPPLLTDYLNDDVSAMIEMPAIQKTIIVQGLELSTLG